MNPDIVDDEVELGELGTSLLFIQADLDLTTERVTKLKSQILDLMGKAKYGSLNGKVVATRSSRNGGIPYLTIKTKG
jgi:hypothetical protein